MRPRPGCLPSGGPYVKQDSPGRRSFVMFLASGVAVTAASLVGPAAAHAEPVGTEVPPKEAPAAALGAHDVELLADAEAHGRRNVTMIIMTDKGEAPDVVGQVEKLGGSIARRFDKVGYV